MKNDAYLIEISHVSVVELNGDAVMWIAEGEKIETFMIIKQTSNISTFCALHLSFIKTQQHTMLIFCIYVRSDMEAKRFWDFLKIELRLIFLVSVSSNFVRNILAEDFQQPETERLSRIH